MRVYVVSIIVLLSLACLSCDPPTDWTEPRKLKPYDPVKAGATIEENFDLTGKIIFPNKYFFLSGFSNAKITTYYDLAIYNEDMYIHIDGKIFIFDKENFNKKREIIINFSDPGYSISDYFDLVNQGVVFYDPRHLGFNCEGFIVIEKNALLLCHNEKQPPYPNYLFLIDLETGSAELLDIENLLDIQNINMRNMTLMGYNYANDQFWLKMRENEDLFFHFFQYNKETHVFTPLNFCRTTWAIGKNNSVFTWRSTIYSNVVWYNGYNGPKVSGSIDNIIIDNRTLDAPENSLQYIDVEYLGTLSIPQSIVYDPPYIWMLAEKDNKVQMLKLLPNEPQP